MGNKELESDSPKTFPVALSKGLFKMVNAVKLNAKAGNLFKHKRTLKEAVSEAKKMFNENGISSQLEKNIISWGDDISAARQLYKL